MTGRHERYDVEGADILFEDTWADEETPAVCAECGASLTRGVLACPGCGATADDCSGSCSGCGARVCVRRKR